MNFGESTCLELWYNSKMISREPNMIHSAEQLSQMADGENRYELIDGVLEMMSPAGSEHGRIASRIAARLTMFVEEYELGETYAAETGFLIKTNPDTVRAPHAAFVSHARLASVEPTTGYLQLAPDLLVEVVSPNDSFSHVESKAMCWIEAGTSIVIVADPVNESLHIYKTSSASRIIKTGEIFEAGDVCGGWILSVDEAFGI